MAQPNSVSLSCLSSDQLWQINPEQTGKEKQEFSNLK